MQEPIGRICWKNTAMFLQIAREIASREKLLIVTPEPDEVLKQIENQVNMDHVVSCKQKRTIPGLVITEPLPCSMVVRLPYSILSLMAGD